MGYIGDIYFWRQNLVNLSEGLHSIGMGLVISFTSVLNPALLSNSSDVRASLEEVSWLASLLGFAGIFGYCIFPYMLQTFGRKCANILINIFNLIGFLIFYYATNTSVMFVAKFLHGLTISTFTISPMMIAEYTSPSRRAYFVVMKKVAFSVGTLICHYLYFYWSWRQIAAFSILPFAFAIFITFLWPESPSYLAMKGRFSECEKSHTWLFGSSKEAKQELQRLIQAQTERRMKQKKNMKMKITNVYRKFKRLDFLKPFFIVTLLIILLEACGRYYMIMYTIQILVKIIDDKYAVIYTTIAFDVCMILSLSISGFLVRLMKRRTILFFFGIILAGLLYILSIILYLKTNYNFSFTWTIPILIIITCFVLNGSVAPVSFSIMGEIIPLEHKGVCLFTTGIIFTCLLGTTAKFMPIIVHNIGLEAIFAVSASFVVVTLVILFFVLIETKDKTLQEIEDEIKCKKVEVTPLNEKMLPFEENGYV